MTLVCDGADDGRIYPGKLAFERIVTDLSDLPSTKTKLMLNLADPESAFRWWKLPIDGIGLARMEFMITEHVKAHPMALAHPERISDPETQWQIEELAKQYKSPADYFVHTLGRGIGTLAALCYPKPMILRMSDFKTNEYATLLGGEDFEPKGMFIKIRIRNEFVVVPFSHVPTLLLLVCLFSPKKRRIP